MGPERAAKWLGAAARVEPDITACAVEHTHLGLAEAVDTLLGVPDRKEAARIARVRQSVDDLSLDLVDILELVHHEVADACQVGRQPVVPRLPVQQAMGVQLQVIEVQRLPLGLEPVIGRRHAYPEVAPVQQRVCSGFVVRTDLFPRALLCQLFCAASR